MLATENCPAEQVEERYYIKDSGIRIGPTQKWFKESNPNKEYSELTKGTYTVNTGEPVQEIDREYGIPKTKRNGNPRYETKTNRICNLHPAAEPLTENQDTENKSDSDSNSNQSNSRIRNLFDIFGNN